MTNSKTSRIKPTFTESKSFNPNRKLIRFRPGSPIPSQNIIVIDQKQRKSLFCNATSSIKSILHSEVSDTNHSETINESKKEEKQFITQPTVKPFVQPIIKPTMQCSHKDKQINEFKRVLSKFHEKDDYTTRFIKSRQLLTKFSPQNIIPEVNFPPSNIKPDNSITQWITSTNLCKTDRKSVV